MFQEMSREGVMWAISRKTGEGDRREQGSGNAVGRQSRTGEQGLV